MTVIAWDLNTLVTDGRSTIGMDLVSDKTLKIRPVEHPEYGRMIGAFCGAVMVVEPWIKHIEKHGFEEEFETPGDDGDFSTGGILIRDDGKAFEIDTNGLWGTVDEPSAYGSGQSIAQHYLNRGADSLTACREAIRSNITCGGHLLQYDWKTQKYHRYVK